MARAYNVRQATAEEIGWIGDLEAATYPPQDAIPQDLLGKWYAKNPNGFFIIRRKDGRKAGHFDVLPLRPAAMRALRKGKIVEREIRDTDLFSPEERDSIRDLYIESIIITETGASRAAALRCVLANFILTIRNLCNPWQLGCVYAIAATDEGRELLGDLGFKLAVPENKRKDQHGLYAIRFMDLIGKISKVCCGMFGVLFEEEREVLGKRSEKGAMVLHAGHGKEPRVLFSPEDRVGLALSGGGIRSATFNLGLLQALDDLDLVRCVDYLATVSGGGYVGGWWTVWQEREKARRAELQRKSAPGPSAKSGSSSPCGQVAETTSSSDPTFPRRNEWHEAEPVRHLREFSRFLSPRVGVFETETWNAIVTLLGGLVPSLTAAVSVLVLGFYVWRVMMIVMLGMGWEYSVPSMVALTATALVWGEWTWKRRGMAERGGGGEIGQFGAGVTGLLFLAGTWYLCLSQFGFGAHKLANRWVTPVSLRYLITQQWFEFESWYSGGALKLLLLLVLPCVAWAMAAVGLLVMRFFLSRWANRQRWRPDASAADRMTGWLLKLALGWAMCSIVWFVGCYLQYGPWKALIAVAVGGGASSGWFAWLQKWMTLRPQPAEGATRGQRIKKLVPQLVAYLTVAAMAVLVAKLMLGALFHSWLLWVFLGALGTVGLVLVFFDPEAMGQHAFYRARITRAYLGASNRRARTAAQNQQTEERPDDDLDIIDSIRAARPLHLVCCAANDLAGDPLATLSRCARSATLSCHGIAIGDFYAPTPRLKLSSALTASAAAFNSNMGSASKVLGPAGTFLMTALDLRLGLWVSHPLSQRPKMPCLPGWLFFLEMFGQTHAGLRHEDGNDPPHPEADYLHLSDGGHFENLALYELVRRHCRYIIVSDCGADIEVVFDDFGNAQRRIREDFGVEIEIDLDPLKPGENGFSRQHMVVGTIHYDSFDKGVLLYFKPTLTGDEPGDVMQYKDRNTDFPHESTGDQFYDEAQWESYRRLGEHEGREALRFVMKEKDRIPYQVFTTARSVWYPTPPDFEQRLLNMTSKYTDLEQQLRADGPPGLLREVFPELNMIAGAGNASIPAGPDDVRKGLHFLLQVTQLMEDVWIACRLETHWTHPLNLGWLNYFQRWACTPTYRMWWPVLKPLYSSSLRSFAEERFGLSNEGQQLYKVNLNSTQNPQKLPAGLACDYWKAQTEIPSTFENLWKAGARSTTVYEYEYELNYPPVANPAVKPGVFPVQVGLAVIEIVNGEARWGSDDLYIPPSLWGAGIGSEFLKDIIMDLKTKRDITTFRVALDPPQGSVNLNRPLPDKSGRQELTDLIGFYKIAGFFLEASGKQVMVKHA